MAMSMTAIPPSPAASMACGAPTNGSTARRRAATNPPTGGATTTNTKTPNRGDLRRRQTQLPSRLSLDQLDQVGEVPLPQARPHRRDQGLRDLRRDRHRDGRLARDVEEEP